MSKTLKSGSRAIIFNVFKQCLAEYQAGKLLAELDQVYKRVAAMTGTSESTIRRIVNEGNENDGKFGTPGKHRRGRPKIEVISLGDDSSSSNSSSGEDDEDGPRHVWSEAESEISCAEYLEVEFDSD